MEDESTESKGQLMGRGVIRAASPSQAGLCSVRLRSGVLRGWSAQRAGVFPKYHYFNKSRGYGWTNKYRTG